MVCRFINSDCTPRQTFELGQYLRCRCSLACCNAEGVTTKRFLWAPAHKGLEDGGQANDSIPLSLDCDTLCDGYNSKQCCLRGILQQWLFLQIPKNVNFSCATNPTADYFFGLWFSFRAVTMPPCFPIFTNHRKVDMVSLVKCQEERAPKCLTVLNLILEEESCDLKSTLAAQPKTIMEDPFQGHGIQHEGHLNLLIGNCCLFSQCSQHSRTVTFISTSFLHTGLEIAIKKDGVTAEF